MVLIDAYQFTKIKEIDPFFSKEYNGMDDLGTSKLFADVNTGSILYNGTAKSWFIYDGTKWSKDIESLKVDGIAKEFTKACRR